MTLLVLGLALFLGVHSVRIVADGWRTHMVERLGANAWKGLYSLLAIAGFVLIVIGYGQARVHSPLLWSPAPWTLHLAMPLTVAAFVLLVAAYVPRNRLRARLGHPMLLGVKFWALAHLLSNGRVADVVLFGAFLAWASVDFAGSRKRDRRRGRAPATLPAPAAPSWAGDVLTIVLGLALWALFAFWLHVRWIGVHPAASLHVGG